MDYGLIQDKAYGRAALEAGEASTEDVLKRLRAVEHNMVDKVLDGVDVKPSLLHGDLWIGDTDTHELQHCTSFIFVA